MAEETGPTLKERLSELEKVAIDFESKLQLNKIQLPEVDLEIRRETLLKMEAMDIAGYCFDLAAYSLFVQRELNMVTSRFHWAEGVLKRYLAENSQNYKGYMYQERCDYCLASDSYAQKIDDFKTKCKLIMDRNSFLTSKIDFMIKIAQSVGYMKRGEKNESNS